jgi:hypothetical protein
MLALVPAAGSKPRPGDTTGPDNTDGFSVGRGETIIRGVTGLSNAGGEVAPGVTPEEPPEEPLEPPPEPEEPRGIVMDTTIAEPVPIRFVAPTETVTSEPAARPEIVQKVSVALTKVQAIFTA